MEETATCELEAAEVLAGLSCSSAAHGAAASDPELQAVLTTSLNPQVQTTAYEHTTVVANQEQTNNIFPQFTETLPSSHFCSTSYRSNHVGKSRSKLTEAEKEERRIRRILANRESARQAIRHRQAMYLELKGKAADVLEVNVCLKKEKELALKEYTSLKGKNEFLKAQIAKVDKSKLVETQAVSKTDLSSSAPAGTSTASPLHRQPSLIPFVWPSVVPNTDVVQLQHALSHSNNIALGPSQLNFLHRDKKPCSHKGQEHFLHSDSKPCSLKGQENDMCITTGQGIPVFVVPVPWLLPFLPHNMTTLHSQLYNDQIQSSRQHGTVVSSSLDNLQRHGNIQPQGSDFVKTVPGLACNSISSNGTRLFESVRPTRNVKGVGETTSDIDPSESVRHISLLQKKNQEPILCPKKKDATDVRRKRKELMKMKYLRFHHDKRSGAPENKELGFR